VSLKGENGTATGIATALRIIIDSKGEGSSMRKTLCTIILCCVVAFSVLGTPVWISPTLWDQDALAGAPELPYPVLAITDVIDGDTVEALLHVAPQLVVAVNIRVVFPDGKYIDTPELGKHGGKCPVEADQVRALVAEFLAKADKITAAFVKFYKYTGGWECALAVDGEDLAEWIKENKLTKAYLCPEELN